MRFTGFEEMLSFYADKTPDAPALCFEKDGAVCTQTYAELASAVRGRAEALRQSGGTCLGVIADGGIECALTLLAAPASGMRTVLFDAAMPEEAVRAQAGKLEVDRMFAEGELKKANLRADSSDSKIYAEAVQTLESAAAAKSSKSDAAVIQDSESAVTAIQSSKSDTADIQNAGSDVSGMINSNNASGEILFFTSGTTGAGRAVILTEQTLCASACNGSAMLPLAPGDRLLCILPLNHVFGFVCGFLWGLSCGACVALGRGARHYIDDCAYFKPTAVSAVPMLFGFLLKHNLLNPECKLVLVGAGDCQASLLRVAKDQGIRVSFGYGLTETSSGVAISVEGDPFAMAVCPDDEITIAEDGEILIRTSTCMMKGYAGEPEATAEVLQNGVLSTGDLGYLDQDGKLHVTGRKKEMLVFMDGTKLFLPEAEAELVRLTGIEDLAIALSGERPVLILGGEPEGGTGKSSDRDMGKAEKGKTADGKVTGSENPGGKTQDSEAAERKDEIFEAQEENDAETVIWEKIRSFQDARPRGQQISAIRWYGKPLPRTATGKLKRWMISV